MEIRYNDQHVRSHPELRVIAADYLRGYTGEFDPIIAAKDLLPDLPTPIVRMVLNVMRADPRAVHLLPNLISVPNPIQESSTAAIAAAKPPREKYRPAYIDLPATWNKKFIAATTKNATAVHLLSPVHSSLRYYPHVGEYRMSLRTWCGQLLTTGVALDEKPEGRHDCRQCGINKEAIETRAAENQARIDQMKGTAA